LYNRLKPIKSKENEEKMGVVNLQRKEGGHFQADLGGQYQRILQYQCRNDDTAYKLYYKIYYVIKNGCIYLIYSHLIF